MTAFCRNSLKKLFACKVALCETAKLPASSTLNVD